MTPEQADKDLIERKKRAIDCFVEQGLPHWKRTQNGMRLFKGLPLSSFPAPRQRSIERAFRRINAVLARYPIKTWDDYQLIPDKDLDAMESILLRC